jgi:hypothetical protein
MERDRLPTFQVKLSFLDSRGVTTTVEDTQVRAPDALTAVGHVITRKWMPPQENLRTIHATRFMGY